MIVFDLETIGDVRGKEHEWDAFRKKRDLPDDATGGLWPEFGKIHTICGLRVDEDAEGLPVMGKFSESIGSHLDSDCDLIRQFHEFMAPYGGYRLCGWNIKGFDLPFLGRRSIYNKLHLPPQLQIGDKKPWEIPHVDLMDCIKFGGSEKVSLANFCVSVGIPTPKDDIDGSQVHGASERGEHERIRFYCQKDVGATTQGVRVLVSAGLISFTPPGGRRGR